MPQLILASGSATRARLLCEAGLDFEIMKPAVDEAAVKESCRAENASVEETATLLAGLKAAAVARRCPAGCFVLGSDQMLACDGAWFDKPADVAAAREQLRALRGRAHVLLSAVVLLKDGSRIWHHVDRAELTMRAFSDDFLEDYLARAGADVLGSVGAYQLEGLGAQLFARVRGDYFTILGLPLLPVLAILREHGMVAS
ncbi:septum formation protein [Dongia mobilis]|uniref:Nucleoside triphosphate pyrophosphatase n=1 Tax=Dongia mobilis TaxID=578943 RepID=A0A4R6WWM2_9PROT|nr:Maf family protein [Dongia mobilis]TDQ81945.1 septum formation protein [Dongia mobilis]